MEETPGIAALIGQRSNGHLIYRAVSRVYVANASSSMNGPRRVATVFASGLAVDAAIWWRIRQSERLAALPRLALDALDIAHHSLRMPDSPEAAMLIGGPLAAEAGVRRGALGLAIPAINLAVVGLTRRRAGLPTPPSAVMPQLQAVVLGAGMRAHLRRVRRRILDEHRREAAAQMERSTIAGQLEVAMDAEALLDRISAIGYLASVAGELPPDANRPLARWKASLAEAASEGNSFLRMAARRWERDRRTHNLREDAELVMDEQTGAVLLTTAQVVALHRALDALELRGTVPVTLGKAPAPRLIGDPLTLEVGPYVLPLPADAVADRALDPAAAMVLAGAGWVLGMALPHHGRVHPAVAIASALGSVGLACWIDRSPRTGQPLTPRETVSATIGLGTIQAVACGLALRESADADGVQVFPMAMTLMALAFLAGSYHGRFGPDERRRVQAEFAAATAISLLPLRGPLHLGHLLAGAAELAAAYLLFAGLHRALRADEEALDAQLSEERRTLALEAHEAGRRRTMRLIRDERDRLARLMDAVQVDPELQAEIHQRLAAISADLEVWT